MKSSKAKHRPTTEKSSKIGNFIRSDAFIEVIGGLGVLATAVGLLTVVNKNNSSANTSATTTIEPASPYDHIDTNRVMSPYDKNPLGRGIDVVTTCSFVQDPSTGKLKVDSKNSSSVSRPLVNVLPPSSSNNVTMNEIDEYGPNNIQLGWQDGFSVSVQGENVTIGEAGGGYDPSHRERDTSPNGSFNLAPGNYATGQFGLVDYSIENNGNRFYLELECDPQKTYQLLNHDNATNP